MRHAGVDVLLRYGSGPGPMSLYKLSPYLPALELTPLEAALQYPHTADSTLLYVLLQHVDEEQIQEARRCRL